VFDSLWITLQRYKNQEKKPTKGRFFLQTAVGILTAIATSLGVTSCM